MATWISIIRPAAPSPQRNPGAGGADEAILSADDLTGVALAVGVRRPLGISGLLGPRIVRYLTARALAIRGRRRPTGPGRRSFKSDDTGSNPVGGTMPAS